MIGGRTVCDRFFSNIPSWRMGIYTAYMDAVKEKNIYSQAVATSIFFKVAKAWRAQIRIEAKDEEIGAVDMHSGGSFGFDSFCIGGCS
jgi:hypothetical protein